MKKGYKGLNGWIKEIRADKNEVDITYGKTIQTLDLAQAKMVAGLKNPATVADLMVNDRIRARVVEDNDGNNSTWDAKTLVVLRRGGTLFMKVSRWVVPAKIVSLPEDLNAKEGIITVEILPNKFYQAGDVNNLIGAPGEKLEVKIDAKTQLRRRFMGKSLLGEFTEGDTVNILGRLNETSGQLEAKIIRNNSIQKLGTAVRVARIKSVDAANKKVTASYGKNGKEFTITLGDKGKVFERVQENSEDTKMVGLKEISISDLQTERRIRVRGMLNRRTGAVSAEAIVMLPATMEASNSAAQ